MGLLSLIVCLVCWLVVRNKPADLGLPSPAEIERRELGTTVSNPVQDIATSSFGSKIKSVLINKHIWPPFLIESGSYGTLLVFLGAWGIPYLMQVYSMTRDTAANFTLLVMLGFNIGALVTAFISDRLERRKPLVF